MTNILDREETILLSNACMYKYDENNDDKLHGNKFLHFLLSSMTSKNWLFLLNLLIFLLQLVGNANIWQPKRLKKWRKMAKFTGKHLRQSLLFNTVTGLGPTTLLKRRLWHRRFLVNFAKFLRTPFL